MKKNGFTLIELLITLSISSIIVTLSTPLFSEFYKKHKASQEINNHFSLFKYARYSAASSASYVSVCAMATDNLCGDNWSNGLIIFEDNNVNGVIDDQEKVLRVYKRTPTNSTITLRASLNTKFINYTPTGTSFRRNASGNFVYCETEGDTTNAKALVFSRSGRAYLAIDKNNNGIPENGSGKDITC